MFKTKSKKIILMIFSLSLAGCQLGNYGEYRSEKRHNIAVSLPTNAPSLLSDYLDRTSASGDQRGMFGRIHNGIDIFAPFGTPVIAVADGVIDLAFFNSISGNTVIINHGPVEGAFDPFLTRYIHLRDIVVEEGQRVRRGEQIGTVGSTGASASTPHLHFTIGRGDSNPHKYWIGGPGKIVCFHPEQTYEARPPLIMTYPLPCDWSQRLNS